MHQQARVFKCIFFSYSDRACNNEGSLLYDAIEFGNIVDILLSLANIPALQLVLIEALTY